jgi:hypothetical protein
LFGDPLAVFSEQKQFGLVALQNCAERLTSLLKPEKWFHGPSNASTPGAVVRGYPLAYRLMRRLPPFAR